MAEARVCKASGCDKTKIVGFGYCEPHYRRWKKYGDPFAGRTRNGETLEWIEGHVGYKGDDCLEWPYSKMRFGYGHLSVNSKFYPAHRYMCILAHGEPPSPNMEAAHRCHNPPCCNPNHLRWATPIENHGDRIEAGTNNPGEAAPSAFLTEEAVLDIRARVSAGEMQSSIAGEYRLTRQHVNEIVKRKIWKHLP